MKNLFMLIVTFCITQNVTAQKECGTLASSEDYLKTIPLGQFKSTLAGPKMMKMFIHICRNSDGSNQAMTVEQIEPEIQFTNSVYGNSQICFAIIGYDYINNTAINTDSYAQLGGLFAGYNEPGVFDVFVVAAIPDGFFGFAPTIPAEYMVTKIDGFGLRRTFIHEMGHALGLDHTFRGYPSDAGGCRELVNGSNSTTCGDFITDTPADPDGLVGASSSGCTYNGTARDANNQLFNPITTNYLSYWANAGCNRSTFTSGQYSRMQTTIDNNPTLTSFLAPTTKNIFNLNQSVGKLKEAAIASLNVATPILPVVLSGNVNAYFTSPRTVLNAGFSVSALNAGAIVRIKPSSCTF
jgi:Pregnancy-associated plasma protein-A